MHTDPWLDEIDLDIWNAALAEAERQGYERPVQDRRLWHVVKVATDAQAEKMRASLLAEVIRLDERDALIAEREAANLDEEATVADPLVMPSGVYADAPQDWHAAIEYGWRAGRRDLLIVNAALNRQMAALQAGINEMKFGDPNKVRTAEGAYRTAATAWREAYQAIPNKETEPAALQDWSPFRAAVDAVRGPLLAENADLHRIGHKTLEGWQAEASDLRIQLAQALSHVETLRELTKGGGDAELAAYRANADEVLQVAGNGRRPTVDQILGLAADVRRLVGALADARLEQAQLSDEAGQARFETEMLTAERDVARRVARREVGRLAEAARRIVELHGPGVTEPTECGRCNETLPCETVRLLTDPGTTEAE